MFKVFLQCKARVVTNNEKNVIITLPASATHTNHGSELVKIKAKMSVNEAVSRSAHENPNVGPRRLRREIQHKVDETN